MQLLYISDIPSIGFPGMQWIIDKMTMQVHPNDSCMYLQKPKVVENGLEYALF